MKSQLFQYYHELNCPLCDVYCKKFVSSDNKILYVYVIVISIQDNPEIV